MTTRPTFKRTMFFVRIWAARLNRDSGRLARDYSLHEEYHPTYSDALAAMREIATETLERSPLLVDVCQVWQWDEGNPEWEGWDDGDGEMIDTFIVGNGYVERERW